MKIAAAFFGKIVELALTLGCTEVTHLGNQRRKDLGRSAADAAIGEEVLTALKVRDEAACFKND